MTNRPPLGQRARMALRLLQGKPPVPQRRIPGKAAPFIWPSWRDKQPQWQIVNYRAYVEEGFNLNSLVYSAVMYKVRAGAAAPLRAYVGDRDHPEPLDESHPLSQLLRRPNPFQSFREMQSQSIVYLNIAGNCYTAVERGPGDQIVGLWNLRPDRVFIIPTKDKKLLGYYYVPEGMAIQDGTPFLARDIMHVKLPNPGDELEGLGYGLSPVSPLAQSGDVDNSVTGFLKLFFESGTMGTHAVSFDTGVSPEDAEEFREMWVETYGGFEKWMEPMVIGSGGKVNRLNMTFNEMGFAELDSRNETRILGPFGVPPILIGSRVGLERSTYSNYGQARQHFWQDTMTYEIALFEAEYEYYLQGDDGAWVQYDLSRVPAMREAILEAVDRWKTLVDGGVTKEKAAETVGLDLGEIPDGNVVYMPQTMVPVDEEGQLTRPPMVPVLGPGGPGSNGDSGDEGSTDDGEDRPEATEEDEKSTKELKLLSLEEKAAIYSKVDETAQSWEPAFGGAAIKAFEINRRDIGAIITSADKANRKQRKSVAWGEPLLDIEDYLKMAGDDAWREAFLPVIEGLIQDQGGQWATTLGIQFDVSNIFAEAWFNDYMLKFAQEINATTLDYITQMLQQAMVEGWSIAEMQNNLDFLFDHMMKGNLTPEEFEWFSGRMPPHRTEMIARTETIRASNAGSERLFKEWGVKQKEWYSTNDARTRDFHRIGAAWGHPPLVVYIDQAFSVGGEKLKFPGDPAGSPGNTINCRCTVLPVVEDDWVPKE